MVHIVVGYDASPAAQSALAWVADRATRGRAKVELVTVMNMLFSDYIAAEDALEDGARQLRELSGLEVDTHSLDGSMPNALIEDARRADLLVLGITRTRPVRTALKGWIPARAAARATMPTVLVPEGWRPNEHAVMVGVDDDDSSDAAILFGAREASADARLLRLVHGWQMPTPTIEGSIALLTSPIVAKNAHRKVLEEAGRRVSEAYPELGIEEVLVADNPSAALVARADRASLLVLGTHHRGLIAGATLGSVAHDILWHVSCPICIVPNPARE